MGHTNCDKCGHDHHLCDCRRTAVRMSVADQMEIVQLREQIQSQHHRLSVYANLLEALAVAFLDDDDYDEGVRLLQEGRPAKHRERHD